MLDAATTVYGYLGPATRTVDSQRLGVFVKRLRDLGFPTGSKLRDSCFL
jgi:hypothetical protein